MDQKVYYVSAEDAIEKCIHIALVIFHLFIMYNHLEKIFHHWLRLGNEIIADAVASVQSKMKRIKDIIGALLLLMRWTSALGEISLLYAKDLSIFISQRNRFKPKHYRRIDEINRGDCFAWFALTPNQLRRLFVCLRIPDVLKTSSRHVYHGEECLIIMLFHMIKGYPFTEMARYIFSVDARVF